MIKLKSLLLNEFKSFNDRFRNSDTIRIKDQKEYKRIMKYLDKRGYPYYDIGYGKGEWHIQFDNTRETSRIRRELEKKRFKIIDPNTNEGKLTEGKETLVATGKDKKGNKIQMYKTVRWGGMVTHILKSNGKEFDQYAPNLKDMKALKQFKKDYRNIKVEK